MAIKLIGNNREAIADFFGHIFHRSAVKKEELSMNYLSLFLNLLNMTVENAAPYLLITIGGVFVARAGVFNISMEGCTEFAAFAGILFAFMTGQIWVGVIAAFVIAILLNCLFYLFTVKLKGNLSVVGSGINLMAACIPACLLQALYGTREQSGCQQHH
ncbi:MAG: ABC transporter permease subunit [Oscillospiraceae bacterium]